MRARGVMEWRTVADAAAFVGGALDPEDPRASIALGIKHLGVSEAQRNVRKLRRLRLDELRRIKSEQRALLEAGGSREAAPELWPDELRDGDVRTPEGEGALAQICREIVGSVLGAHKGLELEPDAPTDEVLDELGRLGLLELFMSTALEVQSPEPQFRSADAGAGGGDDAA